MPEYIFIPVEENAIGQDITEYAEIPQQIQSINQRIQNIENYVKKISTILENMPATFTQSPEYSQYMKSTVVSPLTDSIKEAVNSIVTQINNTLKSVSDQLTKLKMLDTIQKNITEVVEKIKSISKDIPQQFKSLTDQITKQFSNLQKALSDAQKTIQTSINNISKQLNTAFENIKKMMDNLTAKLNKLKEYLNKVQTITKENLDILINSIKTNIENMVNYTKSIATSITGQVKTLTRGLALNFEYHLGVFTNVLSNIQQFIAKDIPASGNKIVDIINVNVKQLNGYLMEFLLYLYGGIAELLGATFDMNTWDRVVNTLNTIIPGAFDKWDTIKQRQDRAKEMIRYALQDCLRALTVNTIHTIKAILTKDIPGEAKKLTEKLTEYVFKPVKSLTSWEQIVKQDKFENLDSYLKSLDTKKDTGLHTLTENGGLQWLANKLQQVSGKPINPKVSYLKRTGDGSYAVLCNDGQFAFGIVRKEGKYDVYNVPPIRALELLITTFRPAVIPPPPKMTTPKFKSYPTLTFGVGTSREYQFIPNKRSVEGE
jgi:archaellum component FlaC